MARPSKQLTFLAFTLTLVLTGACGGPPGGGPEEPTPPVAVSSGVPTKTEPRAHFGPVFVS